MRLRGSHKIAIAGVLFMGGAYFGWRAYSAQAVDSIAFQPLTPGEFTLVGIDTGKGFKVIVSNQVAQLVELTNEDELGVEDITSTEDEGSNKRRVPLRETLKALQGDEQALGKLVTAMNDQLKNADMPGTEIVWKASDINRAMAGNAILRTKLETDLNVKLDGTPLNVARPGALANGIVIEATLPVEVNVAGVKKTLNAPIRMPFRPEFARDVTEHYKEEFTVTPEIVRGFYLAEVAKLQETGGKEDVATNLKSRIDPVSLAQQYAASPSKVLSKAKVVLTESLIQDAEVIEKTGPRGKKLYDLVLNLTEEGRKRLWQFSRRSESRTQLLVIHNGVAIAAPRIGHELAQSQVSISQIPERTLVNEAANFLNGRKNES